MFQETTAGKTNTPRLSQPPSSWVQCNKEGQKIGSKEDVYPSKDIRQNKAVFNPITQELEFMPEQVQTFTSFYLSFIFLILDTWSTNILPWSLQVYYTEGCQV